MELLVNTKHAISLKNTIIEDAKNGVLKTWRVVTSKEGNELLTHSPEQWNERVLLNLIASGESLMITTTYWRGHTVPSDEDRSFYLGRITEVLLANYRNMFSSITITI